MTIGYATNSWGIGGGSGGGVCSAKDLYYEIFEDNRTSFEQIHANGLRYAEIFEGNARRYRTDKEKFLKDLKDFDMEICGVYTGGNFIFPDLLEEELYRIDELCGLLEELKIPFMITGGGAIRHGGVREEDIVNLAKALDQVDDIAKKHGIKTGYHPHLGTTVLTGEQIDKVMSLSKINLIPDIAHISAGGSDPFEVVKKYADRIEYAHIRDYGDGKFRLLGEGKVRIREIMDLLLEKNPDIFFTIETADGACDDPDYGIKRSVEYINDYFKSRG